MNHMTSSATPAPIAPLRGSDRPTQAPSHVPAPLRERIWRIPSSRVPTWVKRLAKHPTKPAKGDLDAKPRSSSVQTASALPSVGAVCGADEPSLAVAS